MHDAGTAECLGQEDRVGMLRLDLADHPLPERERLRVRIVDAKNLDPLRDPELEDARELRPKLPPLVAFEIEGIDVLVLLRRVLRVLHAAVRPPAEPLGMLAHVRMIRRALESDVERDLEALPSRVLDERTEILERAERGMHALVTALRGTDRPRRARI